ncbi:MAG: DUF4337 family protein [Verrucomicrobia bacterium]|nr:DUF4337 family protein [Verrucomicrobiota bacterium]
MKTKVPEQLAAEVPQTKWGKTLLATPVIMTVIATLLAGLASSEMTKAQYDRALGAQLQSKAGDQWAYFQAKKLRGAMQRNSFDLLTATTDIRTIENPALTKIPVPAAASMDSKVKAALEAIENQKPETEITGLLKPVDDESLAAALQAVKDNALAFDTLTAPANQVLDQLEKSLPSGDKAAARDLTAARMRYNAVRYEAEARLNQTIASFYELQVRKANISAERHHKRSGKFFFGMLAAQAAVIVSTFAIAAQKRSFLWSVAAVAGLAAIIFAIYVYLRV